MSLNGITMSSYEFVSFEPSQDYAKLKQKLLKAKKLFKDPVFPPDDLSLYNLSVNPRDLKWQRPGKIVSKPKFFSGGAERFDVKQGILGDCWLLAAVANLTLHKEYLERVVPRGQSFDKGDYAGIFHFRFWQYGKWVDVVVDDRLPTEKGRLVLMHSAENNEFWSALLEKAYAKLHGSYSALKGGHTTEAMEDFTGGLSEHYFIKSESCPANLFKILLTAYQRGSFIGCGINFESTSRSTALQSKGLQDEHAYSITSVKQVVKRDSGKTFQLVRIRNPWGDKVEWNGPWSDKSAEWARVTSVDEKRLGLTIAPDGEFWMEFSDFRRHFDDVEVTNLSPDQLEDEMSTRRWEERCFKGQWVTGISAGGSPNFQDTFYKNPQYMVTLVDPDEDDDNDLCTFVVAVMQEYNRKKGLIDLSLGFSIYKVEDSLSVSHSAPQTFGAKFFRKFSYLVADSMQFIYSRGICKRFRLKPGRYCIIPYTYEPNQERDFLIRYFTEKAINTTRKKGNAVSSLTTTVGNFTLCSSNDLVNIEEKKSLEENETLLCRDSHIWDHFIWSKVEENDGEYKFVRGEFKATPAKGNQCQNCKLWFSSTYFFNHFKHCVFDTSREAEYAKAKIRWNQFGESVTKFMEFSFTSIPGPVMGRFYQCEAPKCEIKKRDMQAIKEHIWLNHTFERPYRCTKCANAGEVYKFSCSATLELHIKSVHMANAQFNST